MMKKTRYIINFILFILWELPRNMIRVYMGVIKWESEMTRFEKILRNMRKRR